jgi:hypothetical protein
MTTANRWAISSSFSSQVAAGMTPRLFRSSAVSTTVGIDANRGSISWRRRNSRPSTTGIIKSKSTW